MPKPKAETLDAREEAFCQHYVTNGERKRDAALKAGYSEKSAGPLATRLLSKAKIRSRVMELHKERFARLGIDEDRLIYEAYCIATFNPEDMYDDAGFLKRISEMPEEAKRAIAQIETNEIFAGRGDEASVIGHAKKVKMHDKLKALDFIAKMRGLMKDRLEVSGSLSLEQLVAAANPEKKE